MLKHTFRYLLIPAIALLLTMVIYNWISRSFFDESHEDSSSGEALIGGAFRLTNQDSVEVSDVDFRGKLMLVYFGFTHCPTICPTDMALMSEAMKDLGADSDKVQPIFITIDPERDDVAQVKTFLSNFYPGFQGLTGTPEQIAAVANTYKVFYRKAEAKDLNEYLMDHSGYIYLMGRDGKYLTHFRNDQPAGEIVEGIRKNL
jgi:cytochrome oxidase Cu insertion factor (SCO1/SenC/PrrC family)